MNISTPLRGFFEAEARNTDQAIRNGDLDEDFPLNLSTALSSLCQAPGYVQLLWMTEDGVDSPLAWNEAFDTLLELTSLIDFYGGDKSLYDFMA